MFRKNTPNLRHSTGGRFFSMILIFSLAVGSTGQIAAQAKSKLKFGKVSAADFAIPDLSFDSGANAVIISDVGSTRFEGNSHSSFTLVFTRYLRVQILNKNGFDIANRTIWLRKSASDVEKMSGFRASTYNLENGAVAEIKLDDKSVFTEKYSSGMDVKKFTMPALKAGSIFEIEYTIKSPFENYLRSWDFQGAYPCLWSEYEVSIPPPYHYVTNMHGDGHFFIDTVTQVFSSFSIGIDNGASKSDQFSFTGNSTNRRWVKKNVPTLREEPFTTTTDNYNASVSFQLRYFQWQMPEYTGERQDFMNNWAKTSKTLLEDEDFGIALNRDNGWMSDELKSVIQSSTGDEDKARKIYTYIRDHFKCSGNALYTSSSLKEVFRKRAGNVADINLLLTAMLRKAGITADPLILSTRDNGVASAAYPMIREYNYVICVALINERNVSLDASELCNGFGVLQDDCYNGYGHLVNEEKPYMFLYSPDSAVENNLIHVVIVNDDKGKSVGTLTNIFGRCGSFTERSEVRTTSVKEIQKKIQTTNSGSIVVGELGFDSLTQYDYPLTLHYDFELPEHTAEDVLYFNPMLNEGYKKNVFSAAERHYPVEMPHKINETYILSLEIPAGYKVDEMPKSARVVYNDNDGMFDYLIQNDGGTIQMRVNLKLNKAVFPTDEYPDLREFFSYVVKKESEQIVFKKIK